MEPRAVRNNNPLNLKASSTTTTLPGVAGVDPVPAADGGNFLQFDSPESGFDAAKTVLARSYADKPLGHALRVWSGNGYGEDVAQTAGLDPTRTYSDLNPDEQHALVGAMAKREGFDRAPKYTFQLDVDGKTYTLDSDHKLANEEALDLANKIRAQSGPPQETSTSTTETPTTSSSGDLLDIAKERFVDPLVGAAKTVAEGVGGFPANVVPQPEEAPADYATRVGKLGLKTGLAAAQLGTTAAFPELSAGMAAAETGGEYGARKLGFSEPVAKGIGTAAGLGVGLSGAAKAGVAATPTAAEELTPEAKALTGGTTAKEAGGALQEAIAPAQREARQATSALYQHTSEQAAANGWALDTAGKSPEAQDLLDHIDNLKDELGATLAGGPRRVVESIEAKLTDGDPIPYGDLENLKSQLDTVIPGRKPVGATPGVAKMYQFKWDLRDTMRSLLPEGSPEAHTFDRANELWRSKIVPDERFVDNLTRPGVDPLTAFRKVFGKTSNPQQPERVFRMIEESSASAAEKEATKATLRRGFFDDLWQKTGTNKDFLKAWEDTHRDFRAGLSTPETEQVFDTIRKSLQPGWGAKAAQVRPGLKLMLAATGVASGHPVALVLYGPEILSGLLSTAKGTGFLLKAMTTTAAGGSRTAAVAAQQLHQYIDTNVVTTRGSEE